MSGWIPSWTALTLRLVEWKENSLRTCLIKPVMLQSGTTSSVNLMKQKGWPSHLGWVRGQGRSPLLFLCPPHRQYKAVSVFFIHLSCYWNIQFRSLIPIHTFFSLVNIVYENMKLLKGIWIMLLPGYKHAMLCRLVLTSVCVHSYILYALSESCERVYSQRIKKERRKTFICKNLPSWEEGHGTVDRQWLDQCFRRSKPLFWLGLIFKWAVQNYAAEHDLIWCAKPYIWYVTLSTNIG